MIWKMKMLEYGMILHWNKSYPQELNQKISITVQKFIMASGRF